MTENKRFTLHKGLDTLNIMDNTKFNEHIYINKSSKDMELLVGVLNTLHEENEGLKKENQRLEKQKNVLIDYMDNWCPKRFYDGIIKRMEEVE